MNKKSVISYTLIISLCLLGLVGTVLSASEDAQVEIWQLELKGQTQGILKMTLQRVETKEGVFKR